MKFSHYGIGMSNSFIQGGAKSKNIKIYFFLIILAYASSSAIPRLIKARDENFLDEIVKGRLCLLKRYSLTTLYCCVCISNLIGLQATRLGQITVWCGKTGPSQTKKPRKEGRMMIDPSGKRLASVSLCYNS